MAMRIVAGDLKGRLIQAPKTQATRPTSDRARETLFNILAHAVWAPPLQSARVMDVFAGSGALGIEALSRGAGFCLFVESAAAARKAIQSNMAAMKLGAGAQLYRREALDIGRRPKGVGGPFSLVIMDPPYHQNLIEPCLRALSAGDWMTDDALVIAETSVDETLAPPDWTVVSDRVIGAAQFWFLKRGPEPIGV